MQPSCTSLSLSLLLCLGIGPVAAETFYNQDGVLMSATATAIHPGAATCRNQEERHTAEQYEKLKPNDGQPLDVWRVELVVANYSGKALDYLNAHLNVTSDWPPCDHWDGPEGSYGAPVVWTGPLMSIQDVGTVEPGEEVRETALVLAWHEEEPALGRWDIDYDFAASGAAATPDGAPPTERPAAPAASEIQPKGTLRSPEREQHKTCTAFVDSTGDYDAQGTEVTWTGDCIEGLANGSGRENRWSGMWGNMLSEGSYLRGKRNGHWIERADTGYTEEGPYVDGEKHGHWIERWPTLDLDGGVWGRIGGVMEGPYVDGKKHGRWTRRWATWGRLHSLLLTRRGDRLLAAI